MDRYHNGFGSSPLVSRAHQLIAVVLIGALSWVLSATYDDVGFQEPRIYGPAQILHSEQFTTELDKFVIRNQQGKFLFASETPEQLKLRIKFLADASISAYVRGEYQAGSCQNGGHNAAQLKLEGPDSVNSITAIDGQETPFQLDVKRGQIYQVQANNSVAPSCGRAWLSMIENQPTLNPLWLFPVIWLMVLVVCSLIRSTPYLPVLGASFSLALIVAENSLNSFYPSTFILATMLGLMLCSIALLFASLPWRSAILSLLATVIIFACFLFPFGFIAHDLVFASPASNDTVHAVLQSYPQQAIEFWRNFLGLKYLAGLLIILSAIYLLMARSGTGISKAASFVFAITLILVSIPLIQTRIESSGMVQLINTSIEEYRYEIETFSRVAEQRKQSPVSAIRDESFANNTSILIIGESVNKNHMSAYGYPRQTTPNIDSRVLNGQVLRFNNAYSNHTHSNPTLSFMLTQANQYNEEKWITSPSILNFTRAAKLETTWLSNHRMLGGWSNHITVIAKEADNVTTINRKIGKGNAASNYDAALLPLMNEALEKKANQALFLHLYNSHFDYCGRFPERLSRFNMPITQNEFGVLTRQRGINDKNLNCYDNSIFYTDHLLEIIIKEQQTNTNPVVLVYVADHADEVFQVKAHNSALFDYEMADIPLFIWANQAWRNQHSALWENLKNHQNEVFTNDLYFETILGILGISSSTIEPEYDLSSARYAAPREPTTLHGRKSLVAEDSWRYWQRRNALRFLQEGTQLLATQVDSIGKALFVLSLGIRNLELGLAESSVTDDGNLLIRQQAEQKSKLSLDRFLDALASSEIDSIQIEFVRDQEGSAKTIDKDLLNQRVRFLAQKYSITININEDAAGGHTTADLTTPNLHESLGITSNGSNEQVRLNVKTPYNFPRNQELSNK